jgi:hypothetical protein
LQSATRLIAGIGLACWLALAGSVQAQDGALAPLSEAELATLVGPIALYPDDVLAVVLPASTYPLQIVQAARLLDERETSPNAEPDDAWDDSVIALLNYPEVVRLLNDDLDWTWSLGEAVLDDQPSVLAAVQSFRTAALAAGNLPSDNRQIVSETNGVIEITPADPQVVYIPYYEPERVVIYQPYPAYHYYPTAYPLYYYPYPFGYRFSTGYFWGVTSAFAIGWHSHFIHVHHHSHLSHPFYRYSYYQPYYRRSGVNITVNVNNHRNVWRPRDYRGARPYDGIRARADGRGTRSFDGRRYRYSSSTESGGLAPDRPANRTGNRSVDPARNGALTRRERGIARQSNDGAGAPARETRTIDGRSTAAPANDTARLNRANGQLGTRTDRPRIAQPNRRAIEPSSGVQNGRTSPTPRLGNSEPARPARSNASPRPVAPAAILRAPQTANSGVRSTRQPSVQGLAAPTRREMRQAQQSQPAAPPVRQAAPRQQSVPRQQSAPRQQTAPRQAGARRQR